MLSRVKAFFQIVFKPYDGFLFVCLFVCLIVLFLLHSHVVERASIVRRRSASIVRPHNVFTLKNVEQMIAKFRDKVAIQPGSYFRFL